MKMEPPENRSTTDSGRGIRPFSSSSSLLNSSHSSLSAPVSVLHVFHPLHSPSPFLFSLPVSHWITNPLPHLNLPVLCSLLADGIFFLAANRVDNRFVQGMVGTYEQRIGYAFYLHLMGTLCWIGAFVCTLLTTYKFVAGGQEDGRYAFSWIRRFSLVYGSHRTVP